MKNLYRSELIHKTHMMPLLQLIAFKLLCHGHDALIMPYRSGTEAIFKSQITMKFY